MKKDNFVCQICKIKGGKLNVDHYPKTFSRILKEFNIKSIEDAIKCNALWDIENNRTLCEKCHKETPTYLSNRFKKELLCQI